MYVHHNHTQSIEGQLYICTYLYELHRNQVVVLFLENVHTLDYFGHHLIPLEVYLQGGE